MKWYKEIILPAGLLSALIIGAGMFSLPYVFSVSGILTSLFYLVFFSIILSLVHLFYLELLLSTPGEHRFVGLSRGYLGIFGFRASIVTTLIGILLVLTVYLVLSVSFWNILFKESPLNGLIISWATGTLAIFSSLKRQAMLEFLVTLAMAAIVIIIFISGFPGFVTKEVVAVNWGEVFLPYGAVLFALYGRSGISSLIEYYKINNLGTKDIKKAIVLGTVAPALIYLLFVFGVIGLSGTVSQDAVTGLSRAPGAILGLVGVLGLLAIITSYIFLGIEAKGILRYDLKRSPLQTFLVVGLAPLIFYLAGFQNFLKLVSVTGGIFLGAESIMVVLMWQKIKRRKFFGLLLIVPLFLGVLYEILKVF